MKAIIVCPNQRASGHALIGHVPLALLPVLGQPLLGRELERMAKAGITAVLVLAVDRPDEVRRFVGDGEIWGLKVQVQAVARELTPEEAELQYGKVMPGPGRPEVVVLDRIPGDPLESLWQHSAALFSALAHALASKAVTPALTMREVSPGIWISLRARVDETAIISAPAWIGPDVRVEARALVGPRAIVEAGAYLDKGSAVSHSWIGPATYIGVGTHVENSFAWGKELVNWKDESSLLVHDSFVMHDLTASPVSSKWKITWTDRLLAFVLLALLAPLALGAVLCSWFSRRKALVPAGFFSSSEGRDVQLMMLSGCRGLMARWPEFWQVIRGRMALVGNRHLSGQMAAKLPEDILGEWHKHPPGVFSLADAEGDDPEAFPEALAHATFFTAANSTAVRLKILHRCLGRLLRFSSSNGLVRLSTSRSSDEYSSTTPNHQF